MYRDDLVSLEGWRRVREIVSREMSYRKGSKKRQRFRGAVPALAEGVCGLSVCAKGLGDWCLEGSLEDFGRVAGATL